jgi:hypothetical protein
MDPNPSNSSRESKSYLPVGRIWSTSASLNRRLRLSQFFHSSLSREHQVTIRPHPDAAILDHRNTGRDRTIHAF